jgi:4-alpha-glucanotransferase
MPQPINFCLALHNHQPIGNFEGVFEQAYQDSYLPFLEVFEPYSDLRISLHTSGPLMEWLDEHHSEYLDRLAALVDAGRVEILGGSFYEAILAMISSRDRVGQIRDYSKWLEQRLGATVQGMWIPERVWEQPMAADIADAGINYTVLDDFHFKNAGLSEEDLTGYFSTEDNGRTLSVFPGSERLRYLIPFGAPHEIVDYLRGIAERNPGAVVTFGDDGEKFGTWPDTKQHVYGDGWLRRFFDALVENRDWINTTTMAEAARTTPSAGKIYLPDGSYREMTEWVLEADTQVEYENITHDMKSDPRWERLARFVRGGNWRNFKVKYPEANEMYSRMMQVSRRLAQAEAAGATGDEITWARRELYRGQCNCSYWHGAFGGIYLPHLRNAVYNHLIAADNLLDKVADKPATWVEATAGDYNFDQQQEIRLANDRVIALVAPLTGGHLYELDVRSICHNLLATLTRRPEAYHRKVLAGANADNENVASIHDRVVFKQEGLDQRLQYDAYERKSLVDHFYDDDASLPSIVSGDAMERSDFRDGGFEAKLRKSVDRVQVLMTREGNAFGIPIKLTKGVTLASGSNELEVAYMLENLPQDRTLHFSVEFNLAGLPAGADDRFFYRGDHDNRFGQLGTQLDLFDVDDLGLVDEWLGIDVHWSADRPTNIWTYPIETVSQSEGGFELVHQSVVVQPHWHVTGDVNGRWTVKMRLAMDTALAESRVPQVEERALAH